MDTQCCEILFYCSWLVQQGHVINKKLQINEKEVIKKDWAIENTSLSSTWWQLGDWVWGGSWMGSFQRQLIKEGSARKLTDSGKGRLRPDSCIVHMVSDVFMCMCWLSMCVCVLGGLNSTSGVQSFSTIFHWTWSSSTQLDWLSREPRKFYCWHQVRNYKHVPWCLALVGSRDPHASVASVSLTYPHPVHIILRRIGFSEPLFPYL